MNAKLLVTLTIMLIMSVSVMAVVSCNDSCAASSTYTIKGMVGEPGDSGMAPATGASVSLEINGVRYMDIVDENGVFEINGIAVDDKSELKDILFTCEKEGYSVISVGTDNFTVDGTAIHLDLSGTDPVENVYTISSDMYHCVVISDTRVIISVTVNGEKDYLKGVDVGLYQDNVQKYSGQTDSNGMCTFSSKVLIGSYTMKLSCDGYKDYQANINITKTDTSFPVTMTAKEVQTFYGITAYHILMIIGVLIGLVLVSISYVLCSRSWKNRKNA